MSADKSQPSGGFAFIRLLTIVWALGAGWLFSTHAPAQNAYPLGTSDSTGLAHIDLRSWDPIGDGPQNLGGKWDFLGNQFIPPDAFRKNRELPGLIPIEVPSTWVRQSSVLGPMGSFGFATYHVRLSLPEHHEPLSIRVTNWNMAWRIFANGREIGALGNPDADPSNEWSSPSRVIVPLPDESDIDLVVHISNHIFVQGGLTTTATIGRTKDLEIREQWADFSDAALIAVNSIFSATFLFLFLVRIRRPEYLTLFILSILFTIRIISLSRTIGDVLPDFPMLLLARAEYATWFCLPLNYYILLRQRFRQETSVLVASLLIIAAGIGTFFSLAAPIGLLILIEPFGVANTLFAVVTGLYSVFLAALRRRPDSRMMNLLTAVVAFAAVNDLAVTFHLVASIPLLPVSFVLFIVAHLIAIGGQLENQITEGEKRVQVLTDSLPVALFQILVKADQQTEILYVSSGFERLLGITPDALKDTNRLIDEIVAQQDREQLLAELRRAITTDALVEFSFRLVPQGPVERWIEIQAKRRRSQGSDILLEGLLRDVSAQQELEGKLRDLATTDSLTGLSNRRHFIESTQRELARANRFGHSVALLVVDADRFKTINDTYGHAAGDVVLIEIARRLREGTRDVDIIGRLGGEEFGLTLPETDAAGAILTAERLRLQVGGKPIMVNDLAITATISIGVVTEHSSSGDLGKMFVMADRAMYHAKKKGRNRVIVADQSSSES
jgi:diguanylate cyclase (GGDEF)-like protein/PAS domain S-box-containing protein